MEDGSLHTSIISQLLAASTALYEEGRCCSTNIVVDTTWHALLQSAVLVPIPPSMITMFCLSSYYWVS